MTKLAALALFTIVPVARAGEHPRACDPGKGVNVYSLEKEIALGREMAREVELGVKLIEDPAVTDYVNRLGQNLARNSDAKTPLSVKVIDSDEVNAFALPGGFLYVNTGLIREAENEAEFAGVMAHEIAHVAARHGAKQATRAEIVNWATVPLVFTGGWMGLAIREAATFAMPLGFVGFSRRMESQADRLGLGYMEKAGYDPAAFVNFLEKMEALDRKPTAAGRVFASHPMTNSRIERAQKEIQNRFQPRAEYVQDTTEFRQVHARLAQLRDMSGKIVVGLWPSLR
jgi:beta-barrel assembly-enhancing protease